MDDDEAHYIDSVNFISQISARNLNVENFLFSINWEVLLTVRRIFSHSSENQVLPTISDDVNDGNLYSHLLSIRKSTAEGVGQIGTLGSLHCSFFSF